MRVHMGDGFQYTIDVQGRTSSSQVTLRRRSALLHTGCIVDTQAIHKKRLTNMRS